MIVLLLYHGQVSVERGFSANKNLITENMKAKTVVAHAQRTTVDHVRSVGRIANVQADKDFLKFARGSRFRYHNYLDAEKSRGNHYKRGNETWLKKKLTV